MPSPFTGVDHRLMGVLEYLYRVRQWVPPRFADGDARLGRWAERGWATARLRSWAEGRWRAALADIVEELPPHRALPLLQTFLGDASGAEDGGTDIPVIPEGLLDQMEGLRSGVASAVIRCGLMTDRRPVVMEAGRTLDRHGLLDEVDPCHLKRAFGELPWSVFPLMRPTNNTWDIDPKVEQHRTRGDRPKLSVPGIGHTALMEVVWQREPRLLSRMRRRLPCIWPAGWRPYDYKAESQLRQVFDEGFLKAAGLGDSHGTLMENCEDFLDDVVFRTVRTSWWLAFGLGQWLQEQEPPIAGWTLPGQKGHQPSRVYLEYCRSLAADRRVQVLARYPANHGRARLRFWGAAVRDEGGDEGAAEEVSAELHAEVPDPSSSPDYDSRNRFANLGGGARDEAE